MSNNLFSVSRLLSWRINSCIQIIYLRACTFIRWTTPPTRYSCLRNCTSYLRHGITVTGLTTVAQGLARQRWGHTWVSGLFRVRHEFSSLHTPSHLFGCRHLGSESSSISSLEEPVADSEWKSRSSLVYTFPTFYIKGGRSGISPVFFPSENQHPVWEDLKARWDRHGYGSRSVLTSYMLHRV